MQVELPESRNVPLSEDMALPISFAATIPQKLQKKLIHIYYIPSNRRHYVTALYNLPLDYNEQKNLLKRLRRSLCCGGSIFHASDGSIGIKLSGDCRNAVAHVLRTHCDFDREIKVH